MRIRAAAILGTIAVAFCEPHGISKWARNRHAGVITALPLNHQAAFHAVLVARPEDCDSRLEFAYALDRVGGRIAFEGLALLPSRNDAVMTTSQILPTLALVQLPSSPIHEMLLHNSGLGSPALVVYDHQRKVRIVIQAPLGVGKAEELTRWIASASR